MCFLWDNYLEMHDSDHIVLMGVGDSYGAVRELLINRGMYSFLLFLYLLNYFHFFHFRQQLFEKVFPFRQHHFKDLALLGRISLSRPFLPSLVFVPMHCFNLFGSLPIWASPKAASTHRPFPLLS